MRVKICGITRPEDALLAEAAGADAIGLIFAPHSKRCVTLAQAQTIIAPLGPFIQRVGVFVNQPLSDVGGVAETLRLSAIQLHGDEPPAYARELRQHYPVIKAVSFSPTLTAESLRDFPADAILLDGVKPGSGEAFAWEAASALGRLPKLILAGGLTPDNVALAIRTLRPYAVDVASGVEREPGIKDPERLRLFIQTAKRCAPAL
jgi:phosphoribosylanthranilate isomerase